MSRCFCGILMLVLACPAVTTAADYGVPFAVPYAGEVAVGPDGLMVGFEDLLGDSRCPIGAWCFWEGDAEVALAATHSSSGVQRFSLHTYHDFTMEISVGMWTVALRDVWPLPELGSPPIPLDQYLVILVVEYLEPVRTDVTRWGSIKSLYR